MLSYNRSFKLIEPIPLLSQVGHLAISTASLVFRPVHSINIDWRFLRVLQKFHHYIVHLLPICSRHSIVYIVEWLAINKSMLHTWWRPHSKVWLLLHHWNYRLSHSISVIINHLQVRWIAVLQWKWSSIVCQTSCHNQIVNRPFIVCRLKRHHWRLYVLNQVRCIETLNHIIIPFIQARPNRIPLSTPNNIN